MKDNYFLEVIKGLRTNEEVMLYSGILETTDPSGDAEVIDFLNIEYHKELLDYPYIPPVFDDEAALWGAKTIYAVAQLVLYRENKAVDLPLLLPDFPGQQTPSAILSCDLCLRFLPGMITPLKVIDNEDELIPILERKLIDWHYSAISYPLPTEALYFDLLLTNNCLQQLYINRVINYKNLPLAKTAACIDLVKANLGIFEKDFWEDFKTAISTYE